MLSKSKIKKLKAELKSLNVTYDTIIADEQINISEATLIRMFAGKSYNAPALKRIIEIRDEKKREADNLLKSI